MNLDLRLPLGLLFTILGAILVVDGLVVGAHVLGLNVNLVWGAVMALFGAIAWYLGRASARRPSIRRSASP